MTNKKVNRLDRERKRGINIYKPMYYYSCAIISKVETSNNYESTISNRNDDENVIEETEDINRVSPVTSLKPTVNVTERKKVSKNTLEESLLRMLKGVK